MLVSAPEKSGRRQGEEVGVENRQRQKTERVCVAENGVGSDSFPVKKEACNIQSGPAAPAGTCVVKVLAW